MNAPICRYQNQMKDKKKLYAVNDFFFNIIHTNVQKITNKIDRQQLTSIIIIYPSAIYL